MHRGPAVVRTHALRERGTEPVVVERATHGIVGVRTTQEICHRRQCARHDLDHTQLRGWPCVQGHPAPTALAVGKVRCRAGRCCGAVLLAGKPGSALAGWVWPRSVALFPRQFDPGAPVGGQSGLIRVCPGGRASGVLRSMLKPVMQRPCGHPPQHSPPTTQLDPQVQRTPRCPFRLPAITPMFSWFGHQSRFDRPPKLVWNRTPCFSGHFDVGSTISFPSMGASNPG